MVSCPCLGGFRFSKGVEPHHTRDHTYHMTDSKDEVQLPPYDLEKARSMIDAKWASIAPLVERPGFSCCWSDLLLLLLSTTTVAFAWSGPYTQADFYPCSDHLLSIQTARVLVVGAGGLGCEILKVLIRLGHDVRRF